MVYNDKKDIEERLKNYEESKIKPKAKSKEEEDQEWMNELGDNFNDATGWKI